MSYRQRYKPLIAAVIERVGTDDIKVVRRALIEARPGETRRFSWPYKVWCDEINRQLELGKYAVPKIEPRPSMETPQHEPLPGQQELF